MHLTYVPLLHDQRELYRRPRDLKRFRAYLHMTLDPAAGRVRLPTLGMNPMAKGHVAAFLDALLALDADAVGAAAAREAEPGLRGVPGSYRVALVVHDDRGGWTNRFGCEYAERLAAPPPPGQAYLDWVVGTLWASEPPAAGLVREQVLTALYRVAYTHAHGPARTLRDLLAQEGWVMARAGCGGPALDPEELEYTRQVLEPFLAADDMRTGVECLFGDAAAATLGFTPRGLSPRAGLALALHDARRAGR
jgi:hypothetical protein